MAPWLPCAESARGPPISHTVQTYALAYVFLSYLRSRGYPIDDQVIERWAASMKLDPDRLAEVCKGKDGAVWRYLKRTRLPKEKIKTVE